jgi:hypothetical protein
MYILMPFATYFPFWYIVPYKIWQPCSPAATPYVDGMITSNVCLQTEIIDGWRQFNESDSAVTYGRNSIEIKS